MRRAKSIDELYEEVRRYDIVLTNDAALATALNARVDESRVGGFAYTPRHIAGSEAVPLFGAGALSDLKIISEIANETGSSFKYIHSELENIRTIRRYKKDVRRYLYTDSSRKVYDSFIGLKTSEKLMDSYVPEEREFFAGKKTAVIGIEFFDDLDKHFIPKGHDEIDIFTDGRYDLELIYEVGNDRQLAENAVSLIDAAKANDTAIVMDTTGPIADAVRAALYRRKIPFRNTMSVKDLSQVRDYLQFLSLSLSYETLRVRHVRELFSGYGGFFDKREDEYFLHKVEDHIVRRTKMLADTMKNVNSLTFQEVCDKVVGRLHRPQITMLLDDMRLKDAKVTSKFVNELNYAVNNIDDLRHNEEIPENEKKGVLLADCLKSVYVDRPFVIFLGLGPEWSHFTLGKEYVDRETEAELDMYRLSLLLQQGTSRLYAVNSMRNGKGAVPCPVFEQINEYERKAGGEHTAVTGFKDVAKALVKGQWAPPMEDEPIVRGEDRLDPAETKDWKFSKSSYNNYFACPRAYMYSKMISVPDSESTIFGNIIHDFAEFYLCYPELVKGRTEDYMGIIREKYSGLSSQQMKGIDGSRIRVCMANIIRFIDSLRIKEVPLDRDYSKRKYKNMFMDMHNCVLYSSMTETEFASSAHPVYGKFDLLLGNRIVDYKTGRASSANEVRDRMRADKEQDFFEFQPMMYLSLLNDISPPPHRFALVYVADNDVRSVTEDDFRISENVREVILIQEDMREFLSDPDSPTKSKFTAAKYSSLMRGWKLFVDKAFEAGAESYRSWESDERLISSITGALGLNKKSDPETVSMALRKLAEIISDGMFVDGNQVTIPSDTLERFLYRVDEDHSLASEQTFTEFPADPRRKCDKCDFFKVCTKDVIEPDAGDDNE